MKAIALVAVWANLAWAGYGKESCDEVVLKLGLRGDVRTVVEYFGQVSDRCIQKGGESAILYWIAGLADEAGLSHSVDKHGHLRVRVPGTSNESPIVLQAPMAMVRVSSWPDFGEAFCRAQFTNGILFSVTDGCLHARYGATNIGANRLGIAVMLYFMHTKPVRPLDLIFTLGTGLDPKVGVGVEIQDPNTGSERVKLSDIQELLDQLNTRISF